MNKNLTLAISIFLLVLGVLGFVPVLAPGRQVLGLFGTNTLLNSLYIVCGLTGLYAAYKGGLRVIRFYGQVLGVCFALATILGFLGMLDTSLNLNQADSILHLILTATFLYIGFAGEDLPTSTTLPTQPQNPNS